MNDTTAAIWHGSSLVEIYVFIIRGEDIVQNIDRGTSRPIAAREYERDESRALTAGVGG